MVISNVKKKDSSVTTNTKTPKLFCLGCKGVDSFVHLHHKQSKKEMEEMDLSSKSSYYYYSVLGVHRDSSTSEIRRAYRKLAMEWHPDRWRRKTRNQKLLLEAEQKFQQIQEAYSVLSDQRKRIMYDAGLYNPYQEEDEEKNVEGFSDFIQEMVSLMASVRREEKVYSIHELQQMFMEMAQG